MTEYAFDMVSKGLTEDQAETLVLMMTLFADACGGTIAGGYSPVEREEGTVEGEHDRLWRAMDVLRQHIHGHDARLKDLEGEADDG